MENKEMLKELRSIMGLNRREFAEYFCIPYRTVQEWELAHRNMPDYLLRLMLYSEKLRSENKFYSASKNVSISELPIVLSEPMGFLLHRPRNLLSPQALIWAVPALYISLCYLS